MEELKYQFEFIRETMVEALTWHSAPYTGSVKTLIPKGTRAWLGVRMNPVSHYFYLVDGPYSERIIETAQARAREVSPIPKRFNGELSFFIIIPQLLSDSIQFLSAEQAGGESVGEPEEILSTLRAELMQVRQCEIHEETE